MKSLRHYHRKWKIWRNKQIKPSTFKKITPLMLVVLLSKEMYGQDKRLNDFLPNNDFLTLYCYFRDYESKFVDIDSDGDLDLIFLNDYEFDEYNHYASVFLKNNGIKGIPNYVEDNFIKDSSNLYFLLSIDSITKDVNAYLPCFFYDFDHDGDVDILRKEFDNFGNYLKFYKNNPFNKNPVFDTTPSIAINFLDFTDIIDINGDELEDLVSINTYESKLNYYPNTGNLNTPNFGELVTIPLEFSFSNKKTALRDMDGDGMTDIALIKTDQTRYYNDTNSVIFYKCLNQNPIDFENTETLFFSNDQFLHFIKQDETSGINFINLDNDHDIDLHLFTFAEGSYGIDYITSMTFLENKNSKSLNGLSGIINMD